VKYPFRIKNRSVSGQLRIVLGRNPAGFLGGRSALFADMPSSTTAAAGGKLVISPGVFAQGQEVALDFGRMPCFYPKWTNG
jgi:hypothetical protein